MRTGLLVVMAVGVAVAVLPSLSEGRIVSKCEMKEKLMVLLNSTKIGPIFWKLPKDTKDFICATIISEMMQRSDLNTSQVNLDESEPLFTVEEQTFEFSDEEANKTASVADEEESTKEEEKEKKEAKEEEEKEAKEAKEEEEKEAKEEEKEEKEAKEEEEKEAKEEEEELADEGEISETTMAPKKSRPKAKVTKAAPTSASSAKVTNGTLKSNKTSASRGSRGPRRKRDAPCKRFKKYQVSIERILNKMEQYYDEQEEEKSEDMDNGCPLRYYGVWQLSDRHHCQRDKCKSANKCNMKWTELTDDIIDDDMKCCKKTHCWVKYLRESEYDSCEPFFDCD